MSETPEDDSSGEGRDGQANAGQQTGGQQTGGQQTGGQQTGGQQTGGQQTGGQQTGGQPAGGQPAGGQQPGGQGQVQGGQAVGQAPQGAYNAGPGVGDIFSIPETMDEIKYGVVMYVIVGIGSGLGLLGVGLGIGGSTSSLGGAVAAISSLSSGVNYVPIAVCMLLAYSIGGRQLDELESQPGNIALATAGVTTAIGTLIGYLIMALFAMGGVGGFSFSGIVLPWIMTAVGAAIVGAGVVWANRSLLAPNPHPAPKQAPPQQEPGQR